MTGLRAGDEKFGAIVFPKFRGEVVGLGRGMCDGRGLPGCDEPEVFWIGCDGEHGGRLERLAEPVGIETEEGQVELTPGERFGRLE